jgi:hypothetical protein
MCCAATHPAHGSQIGGKSNFPAHLQHSAKVGFLPAPNENKKRRETGR